MLEPVPELPEQLGRVTFERGWALQTTNSAQRRPAAGRLCTRELSLPNDPSRQIHIDQSLLESIDRRPPLAAAASRLVSALTQ